MAETKKPLVFRDRNTKEKIPFYVKTEDVELPDGTDMGTKVAELEEAIGNAGDGTVKSVTLNGTKSEPDQDGNVELELEIDDDVTDSPNPVKGSGIKVYVDNAIANINAIINTITQDGAADVVINTFNEVKAFLEDIDTTDPTLFNQLKSLSDNISALQSAVAGKISGISVNGNPASPDQDGVVDIQVAEAEQVNSDWNATGGKAQILNKPTIPVGVADATTSEDGTWIMTLSNGEYVKINLNHEHPQYQPLLTAGSNISINTDPVTGNLVISATGGGGGGGITGISMNGNPVQVTGGVANLGTVIQSLSGCVQSSDVTNIVICQSAADYEAIDPKNSTTLYLIPET